MIVTNATTAATTTFFVVAAFCLLTLTDHQFYHHCHCIVSFIIFVTIIAVVHLADTTILTVNTQLTQTCFDNVSKKHHNNALFCKM